MNRVLWGILQVKLIYYVMPKDHFTWSNYLPLVENANWQWACQSVLVNSSYMGRWSFVWGQNVFNMFVSWLIIGTFTWFYGWGNKCSSKCLGPIIKSCKRLLMHSLLICLWCSLNSCVMQNSLRPCTRHNSVYQYSSDFSLIIIERKTKGYSSSSTWDD